jgi:predicted transcriptional regulator
MEKPAITLSEAVAWAGSQAELARRLGVTSQAVSQWDEIPDGRLWQLHAIWKSQQSVVAEAADSGSK